MKDKVVVIFLCVVLFGFYGLYDWNYVRNNCMMESEDELLYFLGLKNVLDLCV